MQAHKHAELIKQWANGAKIEMLTYCHEWEPVPRPTWCDNVTYRVKPETVHNVGNCYTYSGEVYMLSRLEPSVYALISLLNGNRFKNPIVLSDLSEQNFKVLCSDVNMELIK